MPHNSLVVFYHREHCIWISLRLCPLNARPSRDVCLKMAPHFHSDVGLSFSSGDHVWFWINLWIRQKSLAITFPSLLEIASTQTTSVSSQFHHNIQVSTFWCVLSTQNHSFGSLTRHPQWCHIFSTRPNYLGIPSNPPSWYLYIIDYGPHALTLLPFLLGKLGPHSRSVSICGFFCSKHCSLQMCWLNK